MLAPHLDPNGKGDNMKEAIDLVNELVASRNKADQAAKDAEWQKIKDNLAEMEKHWKPLTNIIDNVRQEHKTIKETKFFNTGPSFCCNNVFYSFRYYVSGFYAIEDNNCKTIAKFKTVDELIPTLISILADGIRREK